jgi:hypothetical protein
MLENPNTLAQQAVIVSAFRNGVAVDDIAAVIGRTPEFIERMLERVGLRHVNQRRPRVDPDGEATGAESVSKFIAGDLAFQHAMHRAIQRGLEKPPMIGVSKNDTPLGAHCHYFPAPLYSGCSSPQHETAQSFAPHSIE